MSVNNFRLIRKQFLTIILLQPACNLGMLVSEIRGTLLRLKYHGISDHLVTNL
jgi:hypothetical protein